MPDKIPLQVEHFGPNRSSLRIALVSETYPPEINGIAYSVSRMVQGLQSRGHEISLIRPRNKRTDIPLVGERFAETLVAKGPLSLSKHLKLGLPAKDELSHLWSIRRPDLIHIATEGPLGWSALKTARKLKIPSISDFRTKFYSQHQQPGVKWLRGAVMAYMRKFHNSSQCTMVPTSELKRELSALGFHNLEVVPRGVDTDLFSPDKRSSILRSSWGVDEKTLVLLYITQVNKDKYLKWVIKAIKLAKQNNSYFKLVVIGNSKSKLSHKPIQDDVITVNELAETDWASYFASADLLLSPGINDGLSHKVIEAMASGLPILTHNNISTSHLLINNVNSLVVHQEDESSFLATFNKAISNPQSLKEMGNKARQTAMSYEWSYVVERIENIFQTISSQLMN
jgi:glycosyltransferase involved in cell wall biosynthesis